ncbi:MAG: alpha/beta fold hydrolase, partial [Anaerolineae bacterium]
MPEDHAKPDGPTLKIAVARFKSDALEPASDPIIYLEGGPGGSPLRSFVSQFEVYFGQLLEKRDVILFDQRGTGYSQPALDCIEYKQLVMNTLDQNLTSAQSEELSNKAMAECHARLVKAGVNLSVFNSAQNAADLEALRQTLKIDKVNLYGISYGTRLALTAMRDEPTAIRSVIIDSVFPPQADLYSQTPANGARALNQLFDTCAADPKCNTAFPNLKTVFFDLVDQLNKAPVKFTITLHSGEKKDALLNGDGLMGLVFQTLYSTPIIPYIPRMIYDIRDGNYALASGLQGEFLAALDHISSGMQYSVQCSEEVPFSSPADLDAVLRQYPQYSALAGKGVFSLCQDWNVPKAAATENQPVQSDIPTLIFAGQFDPITPPLWAQQTAQTLSKSFYVELPRAGHGASISEECPRSILLAFLDDPTTKPTSTCPADKMAKAEFAIPLQVADLKLTPFTEDALSLSSVRPDSWQKIGPGTFTPSGEVTDQTALLIQAGPIKPDMFINLMKTQIEQSGIKVDFQKTGTRSANSLDWTLYSTTVSIAAIDMAVAEGKDVTYFVLLQSPPGDRDALYQGAFLPAIDALK